MKFENIEIAASRVSRVISCGFTGYGKMYRNYLLYTALVFVGIVAARFWNMNTDWLQCDGGTTGVFKGICAYRRWLMPFVVGLFWAGILILATSVVVGIPKVIGFLKYQRAFKSIGLKNSLGAYPTVMDLQTKKDKSQWLMVKSDGIGVDKFKEKSRDLESALSLGIDSIESGVNPSLVHIMLCGSAIPRTCDYEKLKGSLKDTYSFIVGQSTREVLSQSILTLPHLLIAGTTGGGKSVFFKQILLSLLTTSRRVQMYLFDLKGGVEMNVFSRLPNVQVIKNNAQAVKALQALNKEMDQRLELLARNGHTKVDFERDKLDMIVVGVDEASELYGKTSNKSEQPVIEMARELTDRLTKLARATGMHVVLATQKVLKETIDTKIQENIGGRMIFRMNTLQGSMTVLGNKMALELPDIPGRAIWSSGNKFIEVQAPYLSDTDLKRSLDKIHEDFDEESRQNFKPMVFSAMKTSDIDESTIAKL